MAKKAAKQTEGIVTPIEKTKPKRTGGTVKDLDLTAEEDKKLEAYRTLAGTDLGEKQFITWWLKHGSKKSPTALGDATAKLIEDTLTPILRGKKKIPIPQGGYIVTAGKKNNIIVKRASPKKATATKS